MRLFQSVKMIAYDFDGVMTDNHVYLNQDGVEMAMCHRGDGLGVGIIKKMGIQQVIISTETNPIVARRGEKLGIPVIHNVSDKAEALKEYHEKNFPGEDMSGQIGRAHV